MHLRIRSVVVWNQPRTLMAVMPVVILGNFFIMYPMAGTNKESLAWGLEQNKTGKT